MSYAIVRNANYKLSNLAGIYRHNERKNTNYSNQDIDKKKSKENYSLKRATTTYEKLFKDIKEKYHLKGQIKKVSNVVCEYIITSDKEFFEQIGTEETKRFFETAYSFVCNYKNLGEQYILSAKVHMDERTPHMHLTFLPLVHTKDKKGNPIDKLACSEFWKGKNSYRDLQDAFYQYMVEQGFELERGKENAEHLTVEKLKSVTGYEQMKEKIENTPIKESQSNSLEEVRAENQRLVEHCNQLREYCIRSANTFEKCNDYESKIEKIEKENMNLKSKIKKLQMYIKELYYTMENTFNISKEKLLRLLEKIR